MGQFVWLYRGKLGRRQLKYWNSLPGYDQHSGDVSIVVESIQVTMQIQESSGVIVENRSA